MTQGSSMKAARIVRACGALALLALGCTGKLSGPTSSMGADEDTSGPEQNDDDGEPVGNPPRPGSPRPEELDGMTAVKTDRSQACREATASERQVRRLSQSELRNTLADLFAGYELPEFALPGDTSVHGFENIGLRSSPSMVEDVEAAVSIVAKAVRQRGTGMLIDCDLGEDACVDRFVAEFGLRAYRRPLTGSEREAVSGLVKKTRQALGNDVALEVALGAFLNAPEFLWRIPGGVGGMPEAYARASGLSFFLWQTMPDASLLEAAAAGELDGEEGLAEQVRRMLKDPRAARAFGEFHRQWLNLALLGGDRGSKNPDRFPLWRNERSTSGLERETKDFASYVFTSERPSFHGLLNDRHAVVNQDVAPFLGVEAGEDGQIIELPEAERAGILTRPAFNTVGARENSGSPPLRGVAVMEQFLCVQPLVPPDGLDLSVDLGGGATPRNNREAFEEKTKAPACIGCHAQIDGFGMLFELYDGVGRHRAMDGGMPVDASATLVGVTPGDFPHETMRDALEFSQLAADSVQARYCYASQWFRYALGREEQAGDWCRLDALYDAFANSGGSLHVLLSTLALQPELGGTP